jgi:hypothetical protein
MRDALLFGVFGWVYFLLAVQVHIGMPPFYRVGLRVFSLKPFGELGPAEVGRIVRLFMPFIAGIMLMMALFAGTVWLIFLLLSGVCGFLGGLRVRQDLRRLVGASSRSVPAGGTHRYRMLAFDVWTLSLTLAMAVVMWR